MIDAAWRAWRLLELSNLRVSIKCCSLCGKSLIVRLANNPISVRCIHCRSSGIHMSIVRVLKSLNSDFKNLAVYELSSRGPLFNFLKQRAGQLSFSEFFDDIPRGSFRGHVQCQDVQQLTFANSSFDLCTSTEVFEHVPDDRRGFSEIYRVLCSGGRFIFTVPLTETAVTVERAVVADGVIQHLLEPEYHGDVVRGFGKVLCYRNYGWDILERLREAGFRQARLVPPDEKAWWGLGVKVVVAEK